MRNDRDGDLTGRNLPDWAKHGTHMNKALEANESGKKYSDIYKTINTMSNTTIMSVLLSSGPRYALSLTLDSPANLSCLFCLCSDTVVETTQLLCWSTWSQVYNWSLLWTVLSLPKSSTAYSLCQTQTKSPRAAFFKLCLWFLNGGFGTL